MITSTSPVTPSSAGSRGLAWFHASRALIDCPRTARLTATVRIPVSTREATRVTTTWTPVAVIALAAKVTSSSGVEVVELSKLKAWSPESRSSSQVTGTMRTWVIAATTALRPSIIRG